MKDSFITIIAIVLAGIVLFMIPILAASERANDQAQAIVQKVIEDFANKSATTGSIKLADYNAMQSALTTTGNAYAVDMSVQRIGENIGKKTAWVQGDVIGENSKYTVYSTEIESKLIGSGVFQLNRGDSLDIEVKNSSTTLASSLRSIIYAFSGKGNYEIVAKCSRLVTFTGGN